jgi:hypothetical protein
MPTILRIESYRFFFYAGDKGEPEHVHIEREDKVAKFWLSPVRLDRSGGFGQSELLRIQRIVEEHKSKLLEAWYAYFQD